MNYVAITFLVLVVFFLLSNRKLLTYDEIIQKNINLKEEIEKVKQEIGYINRTNVKNIEELNLSLDKIKFKYVIYGDVNDLDKKQVDIIVANFVKLNLKTCGFGFQYGYKSWEKTFKNLLYKLLAACLNYIEMLSRQNKLNYSLIISSKDTIVQDVKRNNIEPFTLSPLLSRKVENEDLKESILRQRKLSLRNIISVMLTILAGTTVTANIIYTLIDIMHFEGSIQSVIACILIYVCYANLNIEIYRPMGKFRFIASYLFPIYIVVFIIFTAYYYTKKLTLMGHKNE